MNAKEQQAFSDFVRSHKDCRRRPRMSFRSDGPKHQYVEMKVTQTGIAPAYLVVCTTCGGKEDISDTDSW